MKCTDIQVGDVNSKGEPTLDQFAGRAEAASSLGKLFIALTQETVWSGEYTVGAFLAEEPFHRPRLIIRHPTFVRPLVIEDGAGTVLSLRGAENAVRTHFNECQEWLRPTIDHLHGQVNDMYLASKKIAMDKAEAAVVATFPEAAGIKRTPVTGIHDLYFFSKDEDEGSIYVVRELDHEFVGGVAHIDCTVFYWYGLEDGIEKGERHGLFWAELARAFAARELVIPEKDLWCESVSATEKPWAFPQVDPYIVDKVVLQASDRKEYIVVLFGVNNLPAKAYWAESEQVISRPHYSPG